MSRFTTIDPSPDAPRSAMPALYWTRLPGDRAESLVGLDHFIGTDAPCAVVTVVEGPRQGEVVLLPSGTAMREDTGSFCWSWIGGG